MKTFEIRKYFISIQAAYKSAETLKEEKEPNHKKQEHFGKIGKSPIIADNKLSQSELSLIEQAVIKKRKGLLKKFLRENNILLQDIITDLQNRLNRPSENGKKYIRKLLSELQDNISTKNISKIPTKSKYQTTRENKENDTIYSENRKALTPISDKETKEIEETMEKHVYGFDPSANTIYIHWNQETDTILRKIRSENISIDTYEFDHHTFHEPKIIFAKKFIDEKENTTTIVKHPNSITKDTPVITQNGGNNNIQTINPKRKYQAYQGKITKMTQNGGNNNIQTINHINR